MTEQAWTPWPQDWAARKDGDGCQLCGFLRSEDPDWGLRVFTGEVANGYLSTRGQIEGCCWLIWRDGHVCEPTDLDPAAAGLFFADMLTLGRALTHLLRPAKLNYEILGNAVPHLHAHVVPRPQVDPHPGGALPWAYLDDGRQPADQAHALAARLRAETIGSRAGLHLSSIHSRSASRSRAQSSALSVE